MIVFIIVLGFTEDGVWTEKELERKSFLSDFLCMLHVGKEYPQDKCHKDGHQDGCLKEGEYYWCVPA